MIIAFEGIDACGKETQAGMLLKSWRQGPCQLLSYPNYHSLTGRVIKELLQTENPDPVVLQSLMLVNRLEDQKNFFDWKKESKNLLLLDRYSLSGLVYGTQDGLDIDWLVDIHSRVHFPDLWIVLDISVEESFRRRPKREDQYEANRDRLEEVRELYLDYSNQWPSAHIIDGTQSPDEIHAIVRRLALSLLG